MTVPARDYLTTQSADGTRIAASVGGHGPPLVLVHGTSGSDFSWALVRPFLEEHYTVYAMQRRGRGRSDDGPDYSFERESEDVAALVDRVNEPVGLVGHSFGANCCLEASLLTEKLTRLVLYEPVFQIAIDEVALRAVDAHVASGNGDAAIEIYLRKIAAATDDVIDLLRSSPTWPDRADAAHTLSREDRASAAYQAAPEAFSGMEVPTLLLVGSKSPPEFREVTNQVDAVLPNSTIRVMEGHGHAANVTAPDLLAAEIASFVEA